MSDENEVTAQAFWEAVHSRPTIIGPRTSVSTEPPAPAEPPAEPEGPTAEDIPLADWAANRAALGIRHQDSDFLGLSETDDRSGFPSWRTPQPEQVEFTEMDRYTEDREAAGIKTASSVFGVAPAQPRTHSSPYSI